MVTYLTMFSRMSRGRPPRYLWRNVFLALVLVCAPGFLEAQSLNNTGTIANTGTFRIGRSANGLPDTLRGTMEFLGANQSIPGRVYKNLVLSGTGTHLATGNLFISGTATVAPAVTLQIPSGSTMKFDLTAGRLTENGYVSGHLQKEIDFASADSSDFGGIGVSISFSGASPGMTTVHRYSGTALTAGGNTSISRYVDVLPAVDTSLQAKMYFTYASDELHGANAGSLELWRSPDNGLTWRRQRTIHNQATKTLQRTGIRSFGRWTAADGTNPLGSLKYEYEADALLALIGNNQVKPAFSLLDTSFIVHVTDAFNQPVRGATVTFAVTGKPALAQSESLSVTSAVSDVNGNVTSRLQLGSQPGTYQVTAQVVGVSGATVVFTATANSKAREVQLFAGDGQVDSVRSQLADFQIMTRDDGNLAVSGVEVQFRIIQTPPNAVGATLTKSSDMTDISGIARTRLTLGSKSGEYLVEVYAPDASTIKRDTFRVIARAGTPQRVWSRQLATADTIGSTLQAFAFGVTDADTNGVLGTNVSFSIAQKPSGSSGDSLLALSVQTNDSGAAFTQFRLGNKIGDYQVLAAVASTPSLKSTFNVRARNGRAAKLVAGTTSVQSDTIGTRLASFVPRVYDRADNPVPGISVAFGLASKPFGSAGDSITAMRATTDSGGLASTNLILGDKVGSYIVHATADSVPGALAQFQALARPGIAAKLGALPFIVESKPILQTLDSSFTVLVADRGSNPLANEQVRFSIIPVSGSVGAVVSDTVAATDSLGHASTRLTLGDKTGLYQVIASSPNILGVTETFAGTAIHGTARTIASTTLDQEKPILELVDNPLVVVIRDQGGNGVPNVPVYYSVLSTPTGSDSAKTTVDTAFTNSGGAASAGLKLGTKIGRYVVLAQSPALPNDSIKFNIIARTGAAKHLLAITSMTDSSDVGQLLAPFSLSVYDLGLNIVQNAVVHFTISSVPAGATGQFLSAVSDTTDSLGRVSTQLTLGNFPGDYEVLASTGTLAPVRYVAKATFTLGDPNSSGRVDVADLTTLIDHVIGKIHLSGVDSARADFNRDGIISIADIITMRNRLLTDQWFVTPPSLASIHGTGSLAEMPYVSTDEEASLSKSGNSEQSDAGGVDSVAIATTVGRLELSDVGLRFNLFNNVPVKGIQLVMKVKNPANVTKPDAIFPRASKMNVLVNTDGDTVRVLVYNLANTPINPDSGALFRLNLQLKDTSDILSSSIIISTGNNIATYVPLTNIDKIIPLLPKDWVLRQNYPNPFNPSTTIEYEVPEINGKVARVAIQIFNILGEKVRTIDRAHRDAGTYKIVWDGRDDQGGKVASGVYIYRLLSPNKQISKKMIMLK